MTRTPTRFYIKMPVPEKILVIRFSSMGDVLIARPLIEIFQKTYPETSLTLLTRKNFLSYFKDLENINLPEIDLKKDYPGIRGIWKLSRVLKKENFDFIIDLHNVLRSRLLVFFLNIPSKKINKGRKEKKELTRKNNKILKKLPSTLERYADVFKKAGFPLEITPPSKPRKTFQLNSIGLAPLSRHELKEWPLKHIQSLLEKIKKEYKCKIFLLGSPEEKERLKSTLGPWISEPTERLPEADFIKSLDLVLTMDSANLHLASCLKVPTVSFWGPTHPYAGFGPFGSFHLIIQREDLSCRPCSVYGSKPCFRKDHACMEGLGPDLAFEKIKNFINLLGRKSSLKNA